VSEEWVGAREAAGMLGVSRQRVFQLGKAGALTRKRDRKRLRWLYLVADVEARVVAMLFHPTGRFF
jgi:hypothetical protein